MDIKTKYGWQELYATALLETEWAKMEEKIQVAENAIRARLHEFSLNHGGTPEENQAIGDNSTSRPDMIADVLICLRRVFALRGRGTPLRSP